jgi:hypothetical protein
VIRLLERIPAVVRWSADRYFSRVSGRRLPPHLKTARIDRATGTILFTYDPPIDRGGWLEDWDASEAPGFHRGMATILYPDWCVPSRAFHHVTPGSLVTLWVLVDEGVGRGFVHVV